MITHDEAEEGHCEHKGPSILLRVIVDAVVHDDGDDQDNDFDAL